MSSEGVGWAFRHSPYRGSVFTVHVAIADSINDQNRNELWTSMGTLAKKSRLSRKAVMGAIATMVADGFLSVIDDNRGGKQGKPSRFRFSFVEDAPVVYETRWGVTTSDTPSARGVTSTAPEVSPGVTGGVTTGDTNPREPKDQPKQEPPCPPATPDDGGDHTLLHLVLADDQSSLDPVRLVFDKWRDITGKPRAVLDDNRRGLIERALKHFPLPDVLDAVCGWRNSPHHRGDNDQGKIWNELDLLLRNAGKIEQFRDLERNPPRPRIKRTAAEEAQASAEAAYAKARKIL